ncbi:MAG: hypothetical protein GY719_03490 [bacterium]|nr:hypothetical protein [bacterium]
MRRQPPTGGFDRERCQRYGCNDCGHRHAPKARRRSIRMTPALKAGVTNRLWSMGDLVAAL